MIDCTGTIVAQNLITKKKIWNSQCPHTTEYNKAFILIMVGPMKWRSKDPKKRHNDSHRGEMNAFQMSTEKEANWIAN